MRIGLLEDDIHQARLMEVWLEAAGHTCKRFTLGENFLRAVKRESFDLLILDWILPDINGDAVVDWLRANLDWHIPVLFVSVKESEEDIVHALQQGADDYMVKPVRPLEMLARITALSRRAGARNEKDDSLSVGEFQIDLARHVVLRHEAPVDLTQKEFDLAVFLFRNTGRLLSRQHLMESVWGQRADLNTRTVDTHISRLRNKLALTPDNGWRLSSVYQHGYRLERADPAWEAHQQQVVG